MACAKHFVPLLYLSSSVPSLFAALIFFLQLRQNVAISNARVEITGPTEGARCVGSSRDISRVTCAHLSNEGRREKFSAGVVTVKLRGSAIIDHASHRAECEILTHTRRRVASRKRASTDASILQSRPRIVPRGLRRAFHHGDGRRLYALARVHMQISRRAVLVARGRAPE